MGLQLTILTATYNRADLLPDLYESLLRQNNKQFIWLVVDDGSIDNTFTLVDNWRNRDNGFEIRIIKQENKGKNMAINRGVLDIDTPYTMIIDSDDYLTDDAVEFTLEAIDSISGLNDFAGISSMRGTIEASSNEIKSINHSFKSYIDATNLERQKYGIKHDCCEAYQTELLKSHPFKVWEGEKFTPEQVVWNQLAIEGYKIRWFPKVTCIVRYQEDGLTKDSWNLYKSNPMGYAMMFNHSLKYPQSFKKKLYSIIQMICCCFISGNIGYISMSNAPFLSFLLIPIGYALSLRRKLQFIDSSKH